MLLVVVPHLHRQRPPGRQAGRRQVHARLMCRRQHHHVTSCSSGSWWLQCQDGLAPSCTTTRSPKCPRTTSAGQHQRDIRMQAGWVDERMQHMADAGCRGGGGAGCRWGEQGATARRYKCQAWQANHALCVPAPEAAAPPASNKLPAVGPQNQQGDNNNTPAGKQRLVLGAQHTGPLPLHLPPAPSPPALSSPSLQTLFPFPAPIPPALIGRCRPAPGCTTMRRAPGHPRPARCAAWA